jgi:hypothetical protein
VAGSGRDVTAFPFLRALIQEHLDKMNAEIQQERMRRILDG